MAQHFLLLVLTTATWVTARGTGLITVGVSTAGEMTGTTSALPLLLLLLTLASWNEIFPMDQWCVLLLLCSLCWAILGVLVTRLVNFDLSEAKLPAAAVACLTVSEWGGGKARLRVSVWKVTEISVASYV